MLLNYIDLMYIRFDDDTTYYVKPGTFRLTKEGWRTVRDYERISVPNHEYEAKRSNAL
jgi:hypothetical protein